jgi:RHH-type rel operon transcriptional repressor/antitoxin RelB
MTHIRKNIETVNISAHISKELSDKLEKVSKFEERAKSYYIKKALEQFLEQRLEDIEDYYDAKKAVEEFKASGEKRIPWEEVVKEIRDLEKQGK